MRGSRAEPLLGSYVSTLRTPSVKAGSKLHPSGQQKNVLEHKVVSEPGVRVYWEWSSLTRSTRVFSWKHDRPVDLAKCDAAAASSARLVNSVFFHSSFFLRLHNLPRHGITMDPGSSASTAGSTSTKAKVTFIENPPPPEDTYRAPDGALYSIHVRAHRGIDAADSQDNVSLDGAPLLQQMMASLNARAEVGKIKSEI